MLTEARLDQILNQLPSLHIAVVGDLFLDRYLDLDATLTEPSVETGLDAYQVAGVRAMPGAAGTIINNLTALGVGTVSVLSVIGMDGEGYELKRELERQSVDMRHLIETPHRRTPTYMKPMLSAVGMPPKELNRFDIKNRTPLEPEIENQLLDRMPELFAACHAMLIADQVSEPECGVITSKVRDALAKLAGHEPAKFVLADSRARIGLFRNVALKPNERECPKSSIRELAEQCGRPVFLTRGERGIMLCEPSRAVMVEIPAYPVTGPIDPVGAGDSCSAGIACAMACGATHAESAAFGNLIASITIQQVGTTGTATPEQVRSAAGFCRRML